MSSERSIDLVEEEKVRKQHVVRVPPEAQDRIFTDQTADEQYVYYWYIHEGSDDNYIYIANHTPREDNSTTIRSTEAHSDSRNRTSIPKEVVRMKNLSIGDTLYYCTHNEVEKTANPSIAILTKDEFLTDLALGIHNKSDDQLLRGFEYSTFSFSEDNSDFDDVL